MGEDEMTTNCRLDGPRISDAIPDCSSNATAKQKSRQIVHLGLSTRERDTRSIVWRKTHTIVPHNALCPSKHASQPRRFWHLMSSILGSSDAQTNKTSLSAQTLLKFFHKQVDAICCAAGGSPAESYLELPDALFFEFEQCTPNAVEKVIISAVSKSCSLDPIPTTILTKFLPKLLPFV